MRYSPHRLQTIDPLVQIVFSVFGSCFKLVMSVGVRERNAVISFKKPDSSLHIQMCSSLAYFTLFMSLLYHNIYERRGEWVFGK